VNQERPGERPGGEAPESAAGGEPTEEELRAALEEQLRRITVQDVILQTVVTLVNLTSRKLGLAGPPEGGKEAAIEKDLEQARLGIDAIRALLPLCPADQEAPVRDALSQLQVVFAREAQTGGVPTEAGAAEPGAKRAPEREREGPPGGKDTGADETARARARSKIWTPPGT
jgi:hypothetical protein